MSELTRDASGNEPRAKDERARAGRMTDAGGRTTTAVRGGARATAFRALQRRLGNARVQRLLDGAAAIDAGVPAPGRGGDGRPLARAVREDMERSFDADFSSVRVHEGPHAGAIGAQAFTQGDAVHFAPGRYQPSTDAGRRLIGHELAHVMQQRSGRADGAQGAHDGDARSVPLHLDRSLEAEADRVGERAAAGRRAYASGDHAALAFRPRAAGRAAPIQANLGIEIEVGGGDGWRVWWAEGAGPALEEESDEPAPEITETKGAEGAVTAVEGKAVVVPKRPEFTRPVAKGTPIVKGNGFELQAEDNGPESTIEFVTNPPGMRDDAEVKRVSAAMSALGVQLAALNTKKGRPKPFRASKVGGAASMDLVPGTRLTGSMQATVGVPLASVPALYEEIADLGAEAAGAMQAAAKGARKSEADLDKMLGGKASGELIGLLTLLRHYIGLGSVGGDRSFPKSVFTMMARTDFRTMFQLLPEADRLAGLMDQWIQIVLGGLAADEAVLQQTFSYDETKQAAPYRIATTREEWLRDMPERDRLSLGGMSPEDVEVATGYQPPELKQFNVGGEEISVPQGKGNVTAWGPAVPKPEPKPEPEVEASSSAEESPAPEVEEVQELSDEVASLYEGIGAYGSKTDVVQYDWEAGPTPAVLIEIRNPPSAGTPDRWPDAIDAINQAMVRAIMRPHGEEEEQGFEPAETPAQKKKREQAELEAQVVKMIESAKAKVAKKETGSFSFASLFGKGKGAKLSPEELAGPAPKPKPTKSKTKKAPVEPTAASIQADGGALYLNVTPGDGNCFFHAVHEALTTTRSNAGTQQALRQRVIQAFANNQALRDTYFGDDQAAFNAFQATIGGAGNWIEDTTPAMVADALQYRIVIHRPNGAVLYDTTPNAQLFGPPGATVHVMYSGAHYDSYTNPALA